MLLVCARVRGLDVMRVVKGRRRRGGWVGWGYIVVVVGGGVVGDDWGMRLGVGMGEWGMENGDGDWDVLTSVWGTFDAVLLLVGWCK